MDQYLSQKIRIVSFLSMIMVVLLHSYNINIKHSGQILYLEKDINWIVQNFVSNGITRIAVPIFFFISGYLFVIGSNLTSYDFIVKIKKRVRTLVIPYLFWTLFGLLFYYILQSFPQSQSFFTKKLIKYYNLLEWFNAIFYEPIPYQLWFLRDLIIMVLMSPIICFLVKKAKYIYLIIIFVFWFLDKDSVILSSEALLFFSAGIFVGIYNPKLLEVKRKTVLPLIWLLILVVKTYAGYKNWKFIELYLLKVSILIGIISFWQLYDILWKNKAAINILSKYAWSSFFLYVFHEPIMTIVKKGIFYALPKISLSYFLVYLLAPILTIGIGISVAWLLKNRLSFVYQFVTGSR